VKGILITPHAKNKALTALPPSYSFQHEHTKGLNGSGIYLLSYKNQVVYVGKYRPFKKGNVQRERWEITQSLVLR
jgi:hypothetical protein